MVKIGMDSEIMCLLDLNEKQLMYMWVINPIKRYRLCKWIRMGRIKIRIHLFMIDLITLISNRSYRKCSEASPYKIA